MTNDKDKVNSFFIHDYVKTLCADRQNFMCNKILWYSIFFSADYDSVVNRQLVFQPGSTRQCVDVGISDDSVDEPAQEDLFLTMTTTQDDVTLTPDTARVIINDNDSK